MNPRVLGPGDDREMIESPDLWPIWPVLPMKNPAQREISGLPAPGFFHNSSTTDNSVTFYEGLIYNTAEAIKTNLTVDEVLAAGWIVD